LRHPKVEGGAVVKLEADDGAVQAAEQVHEESKHEDALDQLRQAAQSSSQAI
jgi:hypothetical protein